MFVENNFLVTGPKSMNPLNAELNPIRHLLALVGARHIVHVSWIRVKNQILKSKERNWRHI